VIRESCTGTAAFLVRGVPYQQIFNDSPTHPIVKKDPTEATLPKDPTLSTDPTDPMLSVDAMQSMHRMPPAVQAERRESTHRIE
jgi:hypothetical protein